MKYFEYRGVSGAVYAEVTQDDSEGFVTGTVKPFVGLSEVAKTTESSNEPHYYDNIPAIIISSTGADELSMNTAGIPFDVLADITGQYYDETTGAFIEQERTPKYFALGYITQKTDGTSVLVWRLKGSFTIPEQTSATQDDGTDANGQTLTYTGISTAHVFTKTGKPAKAVNIDTSVNTTITAADFFSAVQTPDTIEPPSPVPATVDVTGVTVSPTTASVAVEGTTTITATVAPTNATNQNVTWTSDDENVATVANGVVTGVTAGTATITATTVDGGFTATCEVTVTAD